MNVFALDFDGVLCDTVAETAVTAWRAGRTLWPAWQGLEPPAEAAQRFIRLRPLLETGYQAILLMGLIQRGLSDETISSQFAELSENLLAETGYSRAECARLVGQTRDQWLAQDEADWLGRHRFFPHAITAFARKINSEPVFIITTKAERFVIALLGARGVRFPPERIYGLDRKLPKEAILQQLLQAPEWRDARFHFVEDRLKTLLRILAIPALQPVHLYLADWGYNTAHDRETARRTPGVTVWSPAEFLAV